MAKKNSVTYLLHSVLISAFVLALYLFWFVFSDRRLIFLYGHLQSMPFDQSTIGRYWVTGLVASGAVLIVYTTGNLLVRAFRREYRLPAWRVVWKYACLLLVLPIFAIVAFIGKPSMPILLSLWILIVLMSSLALALCANHFIVTRFRQSVWVFFDGLALVPSLVLLPLAIAFFLRRQTLPLATMIITPLIIMGASLSWFWIMTILHKRSNQPYPSALSITLAGLTIAYILAPIYHYLTSSEYIYISNSTNLLEAV